MTNEHNQEAGNGLTEAAVEVEEQTTKRGTTTRDPELVAINKIFGLIDGLETVKSQSRVVRYIEERYEHLLDD